MILTVLELRKLEHRLTEIDYMLEYCHDLTNYEHNLFDAELKNIIETLEKSILYARFKEKGLRIIK